MRTNAHGFTLMELLVSMAVMSILGLSLIMILRAGISAWRKGEVRTDTTATAHTALDQLQRDFAAAFTKSIRPPGPVTVEISTENELKARGIDYFSNEWCTVSQEFAAASERTFHFRLKFKAKRARAWIATYGDVMIEANIYTPDSDTGWQTLVDSRSPEWSGDLSELIDAAWNDGTDDYTNEGTDHIAIKVTANDADAKLLVGTEGPVLRFTAEPELSGPGKIRLLTQPGVVIFVRNFSRRPDPLAVSGEGSSLAEVCYVVTFNEERPGELSPTGTLWRAVRQPAGDWAEEPTGKDLSLFEREFVSDVTVLGRDVEGPEGGTIRVYTRLNMQNAGFSPIAENVLHFGVEAWDNAEQEEEMYPRWIHSWDPARGTPEKVRIVFALQPQIARQTVARLAEPLNGSTSTGEIVMESAQGFRAFAANSPLERFVKIGDEWIYYDNIVHASKLVFDTRQWDNVPAEGQDQFMELVSEVDRPLDNRGKRGTVAAAHPAGTDVHQGETYVRTIMLPYPKRFEYE